MIFDLVLIFAFVGLAIVAFVLRMGIIFLDFDPVHLGDVASLCQLLMIFILGYKVFW
jgi:hypothetical protein